MVVIMAPTPSISPMASDAIATTTSSEMLMLLSLADCVRYSRFSPIAVSPCCTVVILSIRYAQLLVFYHLFAANYNS